MIEGIVPNEYDFPFPAWVVPKFLMPYLLNDDQLIQQDTNTTDTPHKPEKKPATTTAKPTR